MAKLRPVKCPICGEQFDRATVEFITKGNRYYHLSCVQKQESEKSQEQKDKEELESYIESLLKVSIDARIRKQIKDYVSGGLSYSGIRKTLEYFYVVQGNSIERSNGGIGIVGFVWQQAYNYYKDIHDKQKRNKNVEVAFAVEKVKIKSPKRKPHTIRLFEFEEE